MKTLLAIALSLATTASVFSQVPTETELGNTKQPGTSRPGYFFYAKPFEVTMTVNLWGEVPQQGVYVVPTNTDLVQLISFAGGPKERSNLDEVLVYRATPKKDQRTRTLLTVSVRDILEGRSATLPLAPGDMIVVKTLPQGLSLGEVLTIVSTASTLAVLGISIYNLKK